MKVSEHLSVLVHLIPVALRRPANKLPAGRCACHAATVKWCTRHGQPLNLRSVRSIVGQEDALERIEGIDEAQPVPRARPRQFAEFRL